jgi:hypothetical protein
LETTKAVKPGEAHVLAQADRIVNHLALDVVPAAQTQNATVHHVYKRQHSTAGEAHVLAQADRIVDHLALDVVPASHAQHDTAHLKPLQLCITRTAESRKPTSCLV